MSRPRAEDSEDLSSGAGPDDEVARPRKKVRRCANACNRCKSRKQRCDGADPCGNCSGSKATCVFEAVRTKRSDSLSLNYISSLEEKIAVLESELRRTDPSNSNVQDHFRPGAKTDSNQSGSTDDAPEESTADVEELDLEEEDEGEEGGAHIDMADAEEAADNNDSPQPSTFVESQPADPHTFATPWIHGHQGMAHIPNPQYAGLPTTSNGTLAQAQHPPHISALTHTFLHANPPAPALPRQGIIPLLPPTRLPNAALLVQPRPPMERPASPFRADIERQKQSIEQNVARLSLKAFAEAPYVGGAHSLSFARIAEASIQRGKVLSPTPFQQLVPRNAPSPSTPTGGAGVNVPAPPEPAMADMFYRAAYMHVQARYPFMPWPIFLTWHQRMPEILGKGKALSNKDERIAAFFLWLVYAVGARHLARAATVDGLAETYFEASRDYFEDVLARHDLWTIQGLAFTAMYSFRASNGPSVWHLVGFAMRICIEYGLHRKMSSASRSNDPLRAETKARAFWSIYTLDRLVAINLGRPFAIQDMDIDVEEPLDVDCWETNPAVLNAAYQRRATGQTEWGVEWPTSMTSSLQWIQLYRIRSEIVTRTKGEPLGHIDIQHLQKRLDVWRDRLPLDRPEFNGGSNLPLLSKLKIIKAYHLALMLILRPRIHASIDLNDPMLRQVAESAAESCEIGNQIVTGENSGHSMAALYQDFLAGLTLLHVLSIRRDILSPRRAARAIRACSSILVVYSTLFPEAQSFRDMFEDLVDGMEGDTTGPLITPSTSNSSTPPLAMGPNLTQTIWQRKVQNLGGMLQGNLRDDFVNLVSSLGYAPTPVASMDESAPMAPPATGLDTNVSQTGVGGGEANANIDFSSLFDLGMLETSGDLTQEPQAEQWLYNFT